MEKGFEIFSTTKNEKEDLSRPLVISFENQQKDENKNFNFFKKTLEAEGWDYVFVGKDIKWEGFIKTRAAEYLKFLKTLPPEKVVVVSDSRDVLCNRSPKRFVEMVRDAKKELIVSMELFCEGEILEAKDKKESERFQCKPIDDYWKFYSLEEKVKKNEIFRKFVNAGLLCGIAKGVAAFYEFCTNEIHYDDVRFKDDQLALGYYVCKNPEKVFCDYDAIFLHNTGFGVNAGIQSVDFQSKDAPSFSEVFGRGAFFLHVPGSSTIFGQRILYSAVASLKEGGVNEAMILSGYNFL